MKILCVSVHAVLEYDEIRLLEDLGHQVFALGFYFKRTYRNGFRPPLRDTFWHAVCRERFYLDGCKAGVPGGIDYEVTKTFCHEFDAVIVHHNYRFIAHNWDALVGSRVVWRTIGQELHYAENAMRQFVQHGVLVVRWSIKERLIDGFVGQNALIRAAKRPDEWCDWNATVPKIVTFNNNFRARDGALSYEFHCGVVRGLPFDLFGVGNDGIEGWRGVADYERQRGILRSYCATFVTGTWPAPYTLSFIEAWMTGIPVVHVGRDVFLSPELLETADLIVNGVNGFLVNTEEAARGILRELLIDTDLRRAISTNGRAAAITEFGYERGKRDWAAFLATVQDFPPCEHVAKVASTRKSPASAYFHSRCSAAFVNEKVHSSNKDAGDPIHKEQSMNSWWSRFRRRTFGPTVDVFNDRMSAFEDRMNGYTRHLDEVAHGLESQIKNLHSSQADTEAEARQAIREIRWRQEEIHSADNRVAGVRLALASLMGPPPTQKDIRNLLRLITPQRTQNYDKIRIGSVFDGGYVMVNDFKNINKAFSLGISTNDEWDVQIADRGIDVDQYDYTIENAPTSHARLRFFPLKVAATGEPNSISLEDMVDGFDETSRCILKADIEGSEWDVLDRTSSASIRCFSQIICEYHWLHRLTEPDFHSTAKRVFEKLNETHQSIHVHANNCAPIVNLSNLPIPAVLEVTYARRQTYEFGETNEIFPTPLDTPNDQTLPDIFLGSMKF